MAKEHQLSTEKDAVQVPENLSAQSLTAVNGCISHASDLIAGAKSLSELKLPHIAYHLAALALEEIGKAEIIGMAHVAKLKSTGAPWMSKYGEDHLKKLFWAIWSPFLGREVVTPAKVEEIRGLAQSIHQKRLRGLYVEMDNAEVSLPKDAVGQRDADVLIGMASSRIEIRKLHTPKNLNETERSLMSWFLTVSDDPEKRELIFGAKSMEKLVEIGNSSGWMEWLRTESETHERECADLLKKELDRKPGEEESPDQKDKWKIRIRLQTNSHTIRAKDFKTWNQRVTWIKLTAVDKKKDEFLADIILPRNVSIKVLYRAGWGACRRFVCAMNIGSMGYFWWYVPKQIGTYAESVTDLEHKMLVQMERKPALKLDWQKGVIDETSWKGIFLALAMLPFPQDKDKHEPFDHYLTALGFLSKTDVHMQFETNAYEAFYRALKSGMKAYGAWNGQDPFEDAFNKQIDRIMPKLDQEQRKKYHALGEQFDVIPLPKPSPITLTEVGAIKILCDAFFIVTFRELANARAAADRLR